MGKFITTKLSFYLSSKKGVYHQSKSENMNGWNKTKRKYPNKQYKFWLHVLFIKMRGNELASLIVLFYIPWFGRTFWFISVDWISLKISSIGKESTRKKIHKFINSSLHNTDHIIVKDKNHKLSFFVPLKTQFYVAFPKIHHAQVHIGGGGVVRSSAHRCVEFEAIKRR